MIFACCNAVAFLVSGIAAMVISVVESNGSLLDGYFDGVFGSSCSCNG